MENSNDFLFVCQRCQKRIEKKGHKAKFQWSDDSFKNFKLKYKKETGNKPEPKVVLTSCLGPCPENAVTTIESKNGELKKAQQYSAELNEDEVYQLIFKG